MVPYCLIYPVGMFVGEYFDLIDSTSKQIERLLHQSFISAKEMLESARNADIKKQESLLINARQKFYEAVAVEQNESLMLALLGLSMCHALLGDMRNAKIYFDRIKTVEISRASKAKEMAKDVLSGTIIPFGVPRMLYKAYKKDLFADNRTKSFDVLKQNCIQRGEQFIERIELQLNNN